MNLTLIDFFIYHSAFYWHRHAASCHRTQTLFKTSSSVSYVEYKRAGLRPLPFTPATGMKKKKVCVGVRQPEN